MRFLPVDTLRRNKAPRLLAAVDDRVFELYRHFTWRTNAVGKVFRQHQTVLEGTAHRPRRREYLANLVLGTKAIRHAAFYTNLDPLDCRAENLWPGRQPRRTLNAGLVVASLDGYAEALEAVLAQKGVGGHSFILSVAEQLALLNEVFSGYLKEKPLVEVSAWASEYFGRKISPSAAREIILGRRLRLPGYDYAALIATRLTQTEKAIRRLNGQ